MYYLRQRQKICESLWREVEKSVFSIKIPRWREIQRDRQTEIQRETDRQTDKDAERNTAGETKRDRETQGA